MNARAFRHVGVRRVGAAAAVTSLALLLTACGGEEKKTEDTGKADASASAAAKPDVKALPAAELEKLVVEQADLKGYQVKKTEAADVLNAGDVSADKAACEPLAEAFASAAPGTPGASAHRRAIQVPDKKTGSLDDALGALAAPITSVTLGSYAGEGAQQAFASLKAAGTACAGGFTAHGGGTTHKVSKVTPETLTAGDEALAWTIKSENEGESFVTKLVVLRKGNNLAGFSTLSLAGEVKEQPTAVIDAQAAKLR
ncbi:hypothetical protein ACIGO8_04595 [Streptomyces sp. NPDC053493]|uniref:hypothetical protein n=1 Tax=Streptomyces sp. NPDC053493 TaxID=3365705 RepID=UPI0037D279CA